MTTQLIQADITQYLAGNQWLVQRGHIEKYQAVLCDPPYFLGSIVKRFGSENAAPAQYGSDGVYQRSSKGFMGQKWDGFDSPQSYQEWVTEWASLMLDFMHPGAVGLFFGGTRTYHRLVCGLENAGWEIYDSIISWTYSTGFCKNHNLSKAIDKQAGIEREVVGIRQFADGTFARQTAGNSGIPQSGASGQATITAPATLEAANWDGYGTALAPSHENIVLARAPRQGLTYAECALRFGTGALNIDGGRILLNGDDTSRALTDPTGWKQTSKQVGSITDDWKKGRWPKNTLLVHHPDCTDSDCVPGCHVREMGEQSGVSVSSDHTRHNNGSHGKAIYGDFAPANTTSPADSGTAARFFSQFRYVPKANNFEREAGLPERSEHPTTKPLKLTEYLSRLITPPIKNARLLIPFSGSGSEILGAMLSGGWTDITGIEQSAEYIDIARARIAWWSQYDSYDEAKAAHDSNHRGQQHDAQASAAGQLNMFDQFDDPE